ncbi:MAG: endonuclease domain-containing protein [Oscillospiraceae bacterium]|nr:endonuclease domain-containing protein [Oscillospiraceae bacterium]
MKNPSPGGTPQGGLSCPFGAIHLQVAERSEVGRGIRAVTFDREKRRDFLEGNAQNLRKNQTKEEGLLWYRFLCRYPVKFRRQYIIGNYIVDFYCHGAKLAVELDGSQHYDPAEAEKDRARTAYLESLGLRVLRFSNLDVLRRFEDVCAEIDRTAKSRAGTVP